MCLVERSGFGLNALLGPALWSQPRPAVVRPILLDELSQVSWEATARKVGKVSMTSEVLHGGDHLVVVHEDQQRNPIALSDARATLDRPSEAKSLRGSLIVRVRSENADAVPGARRSSIEIYESIGLQLPLNCLGGVVSPACHQE